MQPGFDPLGLGGFNPGAMPNYGPPQARTVTKKKNDKKGSGNQSFLSSLISEGTGAGGAATGALIGSLLGPVGTLAGAGIGGLIGGFSGQALENRVRDNEYRAGDALQEGLLNGVLSVGPTALLKGGKAAVGAARGASKGAGALEDAVMTASAKAPTKTSARGQMTNIGNKMLSSQYGTVSKPVARATNPEETFGTLANYGLTKPADVERVAGMFTGSDGIVNRAVTGAVGKSARVDTSGIQQIFDDAVELNGLVDKDAKAVQSVFRAQMKKLMGGPGGSLAPDADPNDVLDVMKQLEKRAADLGGKGGNYRLSTPERMDQAKTLLAVRDELRDRLYANADVGQVLTPQLREQLVSLQPNNKQWQNFIDTQVMKSGDVGQLRSSMAPFVRARQIIDEADINAMTAGGRMGNNAAMLGGIGGGVAGGVIGPVAGMATQAAQRVAQAPISRGAATVLRRAGGEGGVPRTAQPLTGPSMGGAAARIGIGNAAVAGLSSAQQPTLEDALMAQQSEPASGFDVPVQQQTVGQPQMEQSPYTREGLMADISRDPKNADYYLDLYAKLQEAYKPQDAGSQYGATARTSLANSSNAVGTLDQLEGLFNTAGGGAGKIGGAIQNKLGDFGINSEVASYNALANSATSQLAKAINGGGQVTDADAAVIIQALPKITDSPEVAATKFAALRQRLLNARQNTMMYGASSGLEDALMQSQGGYQ